MMSKRASDQGRDVCIVTLKQLSVKAREKKHKGYRAFMYKGKVYERVLTRKKFGVC